MKCKECTKIKKADYCQECYINLKKEMIIKLEKIILKTKVYHIKTLDEINKELNCLIEEITGG